MITMIIITPYKIYTLILFHLPPRASYSASNATAKIYKTPTACEKSSYKLIKTNWNDVASIASLTSCCTKSIFHTFLLLTTVFIYLVYEWSCTVTVVNFTLFLHYTSVFEHLVCVSFKSLAANTRSLSFWFTDAFARILWLWCCMYTLILKSMLWKKEIRNP